MIDHAGVPMQSPRLVTAMMNMLAGLAMNANTYEAALEQIPVWRGVGEFGLNWRSVNRGRDGLQQL